MSRKRSQKFKVTKVRRLKDSRTAEAAARAKERRENPTHAESKFKSILDELNIRYVQEHVFFYSKFNYRIIDFFLPDHKLNIEIDGSCHNLEEVKKFDAFKDQRTKFKVLRFSNEKIFSHGFKEKFAEIARLKMILIHSNSSGHPN